MIIDPVTTLEELRLDVMDITANPLAPQSVKSAVERVFLLLAFLVEEKLHGQS